MPDTLTLDEIRARFAAANAVVSELNHGDRAWRMSIPARPESDPDIVISTAIAEGMKLLDRVDELEKVNAAHQVMLTESQEHLAEAYRARDAKARLAESSATQLTTERDAREKARRFGLSLSTVVIGIGIKVGASDMPANLDDGEAVNAWLLDIATKAGAALTQSTETL